MYRVTAHSNIYVSAIVFGGKPLTLLEMALERQIELAISDALLSETSRILRDKRHRTPEQLEDADRFIETITRHVYPTERLDAVPTDRDDNRVLECALKAGSDVIVSGDTDLLRLGTFQGIDILRVTDFLQRSTL